MTPAQALASARRHAALRWTGAPLFFTGVGLFIYAVVSFAAGGSAFNIALGLFGTGMGLASFGANHDAAIAFALQADHAALPKGLASEVDEEVERDKAAALALRPVPKVAMVMPLVALSVQAFASYRLFIL